MTLSSFLKKSFFYSLPFLLGLFFVFLGQIPLSLFPYYHQSLPLVLCVIFYFAIFNPTVLNVFLVFLLGIITDSLSPEPLGFNTFIYILVFFVANFFRPYLFTMVFKQLWMVFALLLLCADIVWSFLFFMISKVWVSSGFWFVQYLFMVLMYPLLCRICGFLNKKIKENR